jgi:hypothetical protein
MHWSTAASVSYQQFSIQNHFNFFSATFDFLSIFKNEESLSLSLVQVSSSYCTQHRTSVTRWFCEKIAQSPQKSPILRLGFFVIYSKYFDLKIT